ncbi:MAG: hypothetical protein Q7T74_00295 [Candidatus Saccharibacteria bacterium]|nr:hypothetical protein [Candidatus Saccharibacteria bacterium]
MFNKIALSALCLALIAGCDDSSKSYEERAKTSEVQAPAEQNENKTALYLPGGAGVDFGRQPVSDEEIIFNKRNVKKLVYEFSENYDVIDKILSSTLKAEKYYRHENISEGSEPVLAVSFQKAGSEAVFVRYFVQTKDGVDKKTTLILTWPI